MFIEDILPKPKRFTIQKFNALKCHVIQEEVGTVFVGSQSDCECYLQMQRMRGEVPLRGINPELVSC